MEKLSLYLRTTWHGDFDTLPAAIAYRTHWQYGSGIHSSDSRYMLGSVMISVRLNDGTEIKTRQIVIAGLSQWLICWNVTSKCDTIHTNGNFQKQPDQKAIPM